MTMTMIEDEPSEQFTTQLIVTLTERFATAVVMDVDEEEGSLHVMPVNLEGEAQSELAEWMNKWM